MVWFWRNQKMRRPGVPKISPSADAWGPIMTANLQLIHFSPHDHEASVHLLERMPRKQQLQGTCALRAPAGTPRCLQSPLRLQQVPPWARTSERVGVFRRLQRGAGKVGVGLQRLTLSWERSQGSARPPVPLGGPLGTDCAGISSAG